MSNGWDVLPEKFIDRIKLLSPKNYQEVLSSFCVRKPTTFRANTLKKSFSEVAKQLTKEGIHFGKIPWYKDAFMLIDQPQKMLAQSPLYTNGEIYLQSLSSMIPPLVLDPKSGESILDITAAPGSKTTQMAAMMENTGEIIANDKSRIRMYRLEANIKLQGVTNVNVTTLPGQFMWKKFPSYFDRVLVDVPCSMEGRFFCDDPKTFTDWSTAKIDFLQNQQKFLLRSAISCTRLDGVIVYSTCTLSPEENEGVIDWILKKTKGSVVLEDIHIPHLETSLGRSSWKARSYDPSLIKTVRIFPTEQMEGFFIAKLKRVSLDS